MKELFYFSFSKVLVQAEYSQKTNTLKYSSHRIITLEERNVIEHYILTNFANKTDYYKRSPSIFIYKGKNLKLQREFNLLRLKNMLKVLEVREKRVKKKVDELINSSMSNYYFERIGDTLLEMRRQIKFNKKEKENLSTLEKTKHDIKELIDAYNNYSDKKISIEKAVPSDLKAFLESIDN